MVDELHVAKARTPGSVRNPLAWVRLLGRIIDKALPLAVIAFIGWGSYLVTFEVGCTSQSRSDSSLDQTYEHETGGP